VKRVETRNSFVVMSSGLSPSRDPWMIFSVARIFLIKGFKGLIKAQGPLLGLIAAISLIYLWQATFGRENYINFMAVPVEIVSAWKSIRLGDFSSANLVEMSTMLTSTVLHGGADHLMGNMIFLWIFAAIAVELLGHRWMFATFLFTGFTGSLCHIALNSNQEIPCLGASGAVMGFEGLYLGMASRWHLPDPHVWPMARPIPPGQLAMIGVIGLAFDFIGFMDGGTGVAYGAHLGGFIGGMVMGGLIVPKPFVAGKRR
jgi:membrane associated rhomboid family serine protease